MAPPLILLRAFTAEGTAKRWRGAWAIAARPQTIALYAPIGALRAGRSSAIMTAR
jgi:hypothetical protein